LLGEALSSEKECWEIFREMVAEAIAEMRPIRRTVAEEN
jgi:hypothetical protein